MAMGNWKLASAAPPIRGNNKLMVIVGGGGDKRGDNCGKWGDRKGSRWRQLGGDI